MSRAEEKAKLATENYGKTKKGKFSYQKPPSGVKLENIINEVSSSEPNKIKTNKEKKLHVQFNFRRKKSSEKEKKNKEKPSTQGQKKTASKVTDKKFPVCDSCKSIVDNIYLTCTLCTKVYHFSCAHPLSNFGDNVPSLTYVCPGCVHNNNTSFHHFLSRAATHKVLFEDNFIKDQFELWHNLKSYNKIDIRYLSFPQAHHYCILPRAEDILVTSKSGIWNFFNNCYLSVIVHTLLGTVFNAFYLPLLRIPMG